MLIKLVFPPHKLISDHFCLTFVLKYDGKKKYYIKFGHNEPWERVRELFKNYYDTAKG